MLASEENMRTELSNRSCTCLKQNVKGRLEVRDKRSNSLWRALDQRKTYGIDSTVWVVVLLVSVSVMCYKVAGVNILMPS